MVLWAALSQNDPDFEAAKQHGRVIIDLCCTMLAGCSSAMEQSSKQLSYIDAFYEAGRVDALVQRFDQ
jgi:hypothetical protein